MKKIKNMALENEQIKTNLSLENTQRTAAYNALKAETIKENFDPILQKIHQEIPIKGKLLHNFSSIINF